MDTGADAEILNLLELPTVAPDLWQMMTRAEVTDFKRKAPAHTSKLEQVSSDTITTDARVPVLIS